MLEAVPWENPTYGISGGAAGNVAYGETVNPPRNRKGGAGNPPPTGARASALPNDDQTTVTDETNAIEFCPSVIKSNSLDFEQRRCGA